METEAQRIDRQRLRRYIEREQLTSIMNNAKWQRLFDALESIQGVLDFRRKDVRQDEPDDENWDGDLYHVLGGWENIEWLDIRAILTVRRGALLEPDAKDNTHLLTQAVREAGIPFSRNPDGIRIWGYVRPRSTPHWEE